MSGRLLISSVARQSLSVEIAIVDLPEPLLSLILLKVERADIEVNLVGRNLVCRMGQRLRSQVKPIAEVDVMTVKREASSGVWGDLDQIKTKPTNLNLVVGVVHHHNREGRLEGEHRPAPGVDRHRPWLKGQWTRSYTTRKGKCCDDKEQNEFQCFHGLESGMPFKGGFGGFIPPLFQTLLYHLRTISVKGLLPTPLPTVYLSINRYTYDSIRRRQAGKKDLGPLPT